MGGNNRTTQAISRMDNSSMQKLAIATAVVGILLIVVGGLLLGEADHNKPTSATATTAQTEEGAEKALLAQFAEAEDLTKLAEEVKALAAAGVATAEEVLEEYAAPLEEMIELALELEQIEALAAEEVLEEFAVAQAAVTATVEAEYAAIIAALEAAFASAEETKVEAKAQAVLAALEAAFASAEETAVTATVEATKAKLQSLESLRAAAKPELAELLALQEASLEAELASLEAG